ALVRAIGTWRPLPGGVTVAFITLIMANIGATVTPWMIFFQQSAVVDKGLTTEDLAEGRLDTALGAALGVVAAMTISTSSAYALGESARKRHSLNLDFSQGWLFYGAAIASTAVAAGIVLIPGAPLLAMTLTVNVIATLLMAPALLLLLLLVNDHEIMGAYANGWRANLAGGTIIVALMLVGAFYGVITVFPALLGQ